MLFFLDVEQEKAHIFQHVLGAILHIRHVKGIFVQVIDGLPIQSTYKRSKTVRTDLMSRTKPTQSSLALALQPRDSVKTLRLPNYTNTSLYFQQHLNMHLLGLATAIHDIAGILHTTTLHPDGGPKLPEGSDPIPPWELISLSKMLYAVSFLAPPWFFRCCWSLGSSSNLRSVVVFDRGPQEGARRVYSLSTAQHFRIGTWQSRRNVEEVEGIEGGASEGSLSRRFLLSRENSKILNQLLNIEGSCPNTAGRQKFVEAKPGIRQGPNISPLPTRTGAW
ncbi:hypothetical protein GX50_01083 [[Emmonsia] crescens]|uniref:Uncharacterized protein n=1 Tax=[Emmonsia] crescens TaxID=73230 RepID=A0A2B7ZRR2_9EURO|nr:hypothetical protein GX50_01083 [Emmonsia crescens]